MGDKLTNAIIGILTGVIGITILAVLVSQSSNTSNVLTAAGTAFGNILKAAVSPVTSSGSGISSGLLGNLQNISLTSGSGLAV
jgi:hypothetical protein